MNNSTNTNAARYEVQIEHTDAPSWLVAPRVVVGARDEPHARLTVETTADDAQALEAALIEDDLVIDFDRVEVEADETTDETPDGVRVFRAEDTRQVDAQGRPAVSGAWYWEPTDYDGDVLWSSPSKTRVAAISAATDSLSAPR